jgi:HipA-like protein
MKERFGKVFFNNILAGIIKQEGDEYVFRYDENYFNNAETKAISLTLPKTNLEYRSNILFPFFFGLLAEGVNKQIQCRSLKIDENDHFGRLLKTANKETIGAIRVEESE